MNHMVSLQRRQIVSLNFQMIHLESEQDMSLSTKNKMVLLRVTVFRGSISPSLLLGIQNVSGLSTIKVDLVDLMTKKIGAK